MKEEQSSYSPADVAELKRFKKLIRNASYAMDVQLPDEKFLQPNREHRHFDLHYTEPTGMTVINTFHFKTLPACLEAIAHVKSYLPNTEEDERKDS